MTDRNTLFSYRLEQSEETLSEAQKMLQEFFSARSIINRAYYSMFYAVLALFLKSEINIKTSKHIGIISSFDKEFVHTGKIDKHYSMILHRLFDMRQEGDYKEFVELSHADSEDAVKLAEDFIYCIKRYLNIL